MKEILCCAAQSGLAAATAFALKKKPVASAALGSADPSAELNALVSAVQALKQELEAAAAKANEDTAAILEAEAALLENDFLTGAEKTIREKNCTALGAVQETAKALSESLERNENAYIRQRAEDMRGMGQRLCALLRGEKHILPEEPFILVAEELSPAELSAYPAALLRGILTAKGGVGSHVSILAGNLGIPYLIGDAEAVAAIETGERLILRDDKLITEPDEQLWNETLTEIETKKKAAAVPLEKTRTKVCANIAGVGDCPALAASAAEGVGLFRSEFLFLDCAHVPTEEEQFEAYRTVTELMGERECVIRTMDIGSDKKADWLELPPEKNPALGCRGLRVSLQKSELFLTQLRALLRAAVYGNLKIMVPMVASLWEIDAVREQLSLAAAELEERKAEYRIPALGAMVETPAAVLMAPELAEKVDFFSLGTNDLTQYTLAIDREADGLERYYDPCHEAVLRLIAMTVEAGHNSGIPTAICGELGGNPQAIPRLVELGVDELSVSLSKVAATKKAVAEAEKKLAAPEIAPILPTLLAPADGELYAMEEIPDEAFASGVLGECIGILPSEGAVYAPCDATVTNVTDSGHALTLTDGCGRSILLHIGIDTVMLEGKGFHPCVRAGDRVKAGQLLLNMELETIRSAGLSPMVIMAICG